VISHRIKAIVKHHNKSISRVRKSSVSIKRVKYSFSYLKILPAKLANKVINIKLIMPILIKGKAGTYEITKGPFRFYIKRLRGKRYSVIYVRFNKLLILKKAVKYTGKIAFRVRKFKGGFKIYYKHGKKWSRYIFRFPVGGKKPIVGNTRIYRSRKSYRRLTVYRTKKIRGNKRW